MRRSTGALILAWSAAAAFCALHLSTNVGERWIWKLGTYEASELTKQSLQSHSYWQTVPPQTVPSTEVQPPLPTGYNFAGQGDPNTPNSSGDIFDQAAAHGVRIETLPAFVFLHEVEVSLVGLIALAILFRKHEAVIIATRFLRVATPMLLALVFLSPLIWVPCAWTIHGEYGNSEYSDYRWLWLVGATHIRFMTVLFEELVLGVITTAVALTFKFQRGASSKFVETTN